MFMHKFSYFILLIIFFTSCNSSDSQSSNNAVLLPKYVYLVNANGGILVCNFNSETNTLSSCSNPDLGNSLGVVGLQGITLNSNGDTAYITINEGTTNVYQCSIQENGTFSSCSSTSITTPTGYRGAYGVPFLNLAEDKIFLPDLFTGTERIIACPVTSNTIGETCSDTGATGLPGSTGGMTLNKAESKAYIAGYSSSHVSVCDVSGNTFSNCINKVSDGSIMFSSISDVHLNQEENLLYVVDYGADKVFACSTNETNTTVFESCFIARSALSAWEISINQGDTLAFLSNYGDNVHVCPINADGTFAECTTTNGFVNVPGIALKY